MNEKLSVVEEAYIELQTRIISEQDHLSEEQTEELYESLSSYKKGLKIALKNIKKGQPAPENLEKVHGISADRLKAHIEGRKAATGLSQAKHWDEKGKEIINSVAKNQIKTGKELRNKDRMRKSGIVQRIKDRFSKK